MKRCRQLDRFGSLVISELWLSVTIKYRECTLINLKSYKKIGGESRIQTLQNTNSSMHWIFGVWVGNRVGNKTRANKKRTQILS